jgi:hypothetical protein
LIKFDLESLKNNTIAQHLLQSDLDINANSVSAYQNLYIVEPGTSMVVESMPDPVGLKMGVVVGIIVETQELIYQRFQCKNEAIFNISEITGEDISFYGGTIRLFLPPTRSSN